jgi:hypothetical protein
MKKIINKVVPTPMSDEKIKEVAEEYMKDGLPNLVKNPIRIKDKPYIQDHMTPVIFTSMDGICYSGFYIDVRIDRSTVPFLGETAFVYECRHDSNGDWVTPITIEDRVLVDFAGTFVTNLPIAFPDEKDHYILIKDIKEEPVETN